MIDQCVVFGSYLKAMELWIWKSYVSSDKMSGLACKMLVMSLFSVGNWIPNRERERETGFVLIWKIDGISLLKKLSRGRNHMLALGVAKM